VCARDDQESTAQWDKTVVLFLLLVIALMLAIVLVLMIGDRALLL